MPICDNPEVPTRIVSLKSNNGVFVTCELCKEGFYGEDGRSCKECEAGTFQEYYGESSCT